MFLLPLGDENAHGHGADWASHLAAQGCVAARQRAQHGASGHQQRCSQVSAQGAGGEDGGGGQPIAGLKAS